MMSLLALHTKSLYASDRQEHIYAKVSKGSDEGGETCRKLSAASAVSSQYVSCILPYAKVLLTLASRITFPLPSNLTLLEASSRGNSDVLRTM